jgi:hypothetical protein
LAELGLFVPILQTAGNAVVNWVLVTIPTAQALIANTAKSINQKKLWPSSAVTVLLAAVIAAGA